MLLVLFVFIVVLFFVRGNPFPRTGYAFSILDVFLLVLLILLVMAAFGGLGTYSRWPLYW